MLLFLFQFRVSVTVFYFIVGAVIVGMILTDLIMMKLGLTIVKADTRTQFKWVMASFLIQVLTIFIVISPIILILALGLEPAISNIIIFGVLALFIEINVINILHKTGFGRAIVVFFLIAIPTVLYGLFLGFLVSQL
jgi:hypothetical protein